MAAAIAGVFPKTLQEKVNDSKVLVVGAGGIGCEILKNLVLSGFPNIEIIDLDTIDLSNLNRQFLFHREHVGKSKAAVARESALQFNPNVKITAYHDSIMANTYGVNFFKNFDVVLNALDNRAARNHVNRMCLNADIPLIESGTAGYNGQVEMIKKGVTQCYECTPKATQKTFPGCTIRNTPSEPIHCIVWAKHLFNQLFGETVDDEDISPDVADPEANESGENSVKDASNGGGSGDDGKVAGNSNRKHSVSETGNVVRINTRLWARDNHYNVATLFNKFFYDDINYLLSMSNLWKTRKPPTPTEWDNVLLQQNNSKDGYLRQYHKVWSLAECGAVFEECLKKLSSNVKDLPEGDSLVWDKDDQPAMDFVAACANIRAYIFGIGRKSRFDVKSMAGNIIPAIATTNAITAGIVVLHVFKVLQNQIEDCKSVYVRLRLNGRQQLIVPEKFLAKPNPSCCVCSADPAIHLKVDTNRVRIKEFRDNILIKALNMVHPDVTDTSKGSVIISSEEDETECNEDKLLSEMNIVDGSLLTCDDFFQNYTLTIIIIHIDAKHDDSVFEVIADKSQLVPKEDPADETPAKSNGNGSSKKTKVEDTEGPSTSKRRRIAHDNDEDDFVLIDDDEDACTTVVEATDKLTVASPDRVDSCLKRDFNSSTKNGDNEVTEVLDSDDETEPNYGKRARKELVKK